MHKQIHLTPNQEEKLRELGAYLREIRLKQSLSIDELEERTRIKARVLVAIEEAKGGDLPEPIYVRALIQQFADALGLEGRDFASAFPIDPKIKGIQTSWKPLRRYKVRLFPWYLAYTLVLVCAMSGFSLLASRSGDNFAQNPAPATRDDNNLEPPTIATNNSANPATNNSANNTAVTKPLQSSPQNPASTSPNSSPAPLPKPASIPSLPSPSTDARTVSDRPPSNPASPNNPTPPSATPNAPVVVSMTLQDDCWLKVVADGEIVYQGTLAKGEQKTWHAQEQITVVAGNAGGVVVAINNQEAKPLGTLGAVETATFVPPKSRS
ncbi:MAG: helix-turn-helix domain-containing protein [Cyanobacteria bacterium SBLK]|nr:helix-turn-helix domain-containing protein [Cyanobacteria bacterium SBLK]